jgi:hypothetical protein
MSAIEDAGRRVRAAAADGVELIVLPELFHYADGRADGSFLDGIAVDVIAQSLDGTACHAVTTLPDDAAHVGVLISARGCPGGRCRCIRARGTSAGRRRSATAWCRWTCPGAGW